MVECFINNKILGSTCERAVRFLTSSEDAMRLMTRARLHLRKQYCLGGLLAGFPNNQQSQAGQAAAYYYNHSATS